MRHVNEWCYTVLLAALPVFSQGFHAGVEGGVPITSYYDTGSVGNLHFNGVYSSATRRYTVGAAVEFGFTNSLGIEMDAMYHRMGYDGNTRSVGNFYSTNQFTIRGNSWDIPLFAKYHLRNLRRKPFAEAGGVVRFIGPVHEVGVSVLAGSPIPPYSTATAFASSDPTDLRKRIYPGVTAGGGMEFKASLLYFVPELRWTHWTANIAAPGALLRFPSNQLEVLLGVRF